MDRRRFLKYVGATAAVAGASALGLDYLLKPESGNSTQTMVSSLTTSQTPPSISNFQWQPTRVVNGKVYDASISLTIQSSSPLTQLNATLDSYAPTIPARAYPAEPLQTVQFTPSETSGLYSAQVTDLLGGKQYLLSVTAQDAQAQATTQFQTPYVREFENVASLDNVLVGATYHPWWENPCAHYCHWGELGADWSKGTTPLGTPLLGLYNSTDPMVVSKHIDWSTGHGIDFFWVSYNGTEEADTVRMPPIMTNTLTGDVKFAILYEAEVALGGPNEDLTSVSLDDASTYAILQSHFHNMAKLYLPHPSYLTINGRPVVYLYGSSFLRQNADIDSPIRKLRDDMRTLGFDLYLVGDEMDWDNDPASSRIRAFDAITYYGLPHASFVDVTDKSPETARMQYVRWQSAAHSVGVEVIPAPIPGFDDRNLCRLGVRKKCYHFPKSPEFLKAHMEVASDFLDKSRLMMIVSWDEWAENSFVEPSVEDGFEYLQAIKDALAGQ